MTPAYQRSETAKALDRFIQSSAASQSIPNRPEQEQDCPPEDSELRIRSGMATSPQSSIVGETLPATAHCGLDCELATRPKLITHLYVEVILNWPSPPLDDLLKVPIQIS